MIEQVIDANKKREISKLILESLKEWFEKEESRNSYIEESVSQLFFAAMENEEYIGFLCLKETGEATVELAVMGVLREFHRKGTGRALLNMQRLWLRDAVIRLYRLKQLEWGYMRIMIKRICFIKVSVLRSLKYFRHYGTRIILVFRISLCRNKTNNTLESRYY